MCSWDPGFVATEAWEKVGIPVVERLGCVSWDVLLSGDEPSCEMPIFATSHVYIIYIYTLVEYMICYSDVTHNYLKILKEIQNENSCDNGSTCIYIILSITLW